MVPTYLFSDRASGSSESWMYKIAGFPYAYTIELPNLHNWMLPADQIEPTATAFMTAFFEYFGHTETTQPELNEALVNLTIEHNDGRERTTLMSKDNTPVDITINQYTALPTGMPNSDWSTVTGTTISYSTTEINKGNVPRVFAAPSIKRSLCNRLEPSIFLILGLISFSVGYL